ncbi:MAG: Cytidylate kinaselike family [Gemmatimonadetes bacterium]|jgi:cytidylate kinase|nr:Cytidylate kinaselike family [Gemmatimonadota bacterium]
MAIVTISRQYGSGGSEVAERVARALGWQLYDNAVVDSVAARLGMTPAEVSAREERVPTLGERFASAMSLAAPEALITGEYAVIPPSEDRIVAVTQRVMEEAVQAGPAVIVGRGAQCLLATRSDALHVFCYAPLESLTEYAMKTLGLKPDEARRKVIDMNARREEYVKRHWKREWRDLANYHLCVNTAWLGIDGAAELVTRMAKERLG